MNHKITRMSCGVAVASLAMLALVACDNETLNGPSFESPKSSIAESSSSLAESSSSLVVSSSAVESSSSEMVVRPRCDALDPECGYTVEELCRMGETRYCNNSSSSAVVLPSSSSIVQSSSSAIEQSCPNGRWTTVCGDKWLQKPVCCEEEPVENCRHISDYDGMTAQGNCVNQNGSSAVDCVTGDNYQCRNNYWEKVSCLNIKPDECKPGMGGCGYRLCEPNGIKEIADCESGAIYYCNGEIWKVKETENNKRCADGELEYCEACYREGEFEGHYKCENGKWREYGLGDETCVHVSKLKCKLGTVGCGSCDPIYEGTITEDCETGFPYQCHNGFWSEISVLPRCDALSPECGYSEYELCSKYGLKEYCNDKWLSEPCDGSESSRDLRIYANDDLYRSENYICVNGKWVERYRFYECAEELECDNPSIRCQSSPHIGTACDVEGMSEEIDGCVLLCSNGAYLYALPPM